jgi:hypothetical protein
MATYYGTYGQKVQYLASDPSDPQIGQVWYNSTSATLKVQSATTAGAWASWWEFKYSKIKDLEGFFFRKSNSSISFFGGVTGVLINVQQNLIMEQLGQQYQQL